MKDLGLSWTEVKSLPKMELEGLLYGLSQYSRMHQFDGYDENDIGEMAKNKPQIRSQYNDYLLRKRKYSGEKKTKSTFKDVFN